MLDPRRFDRARPARDATPRLGALAAVWWALLWLFLWVEDKCRDLADSMDRWRGR